MKKNLISIFLCILYCQFLAGYASADFKKTKIAVLPFTLQGEKFDTEDMGKIVAEWLITAFVKDGRFEVIERRLLGQVLEEQQMVEAGIVNQETATEIGRILGVKVIISGSIMKLKNVIEVNARIIDVGSASIVTAENVSSTHLTGLHEMVVEMAGKIIKNFPLQGYIVKRKKEKVAVDLGKIVGMKSGMKFMAYKQGDVVRHPKTNEILYVQHIKTGIIKITDVMQKISEGVIVEEVSPDSIQYGDMVKSVKSTVDKSHSIEIPGTSAMRQGRLFVHPNPPFARVRILNIQPRYADGMDLSPGSYHIEVSARGYRTEMQWVTIGDREEKHMDVTLHRGHAVAGSPVDKYITMLKSNNGPRMRKAAKILIRKYPDNPRVLNAAEHVLLAGYASHSGNRVYVDAMAYLCKMLGRSGKKRFKPTLEKVAREATDRKLKRYAGSSLKYLEQ